MGKNVIQISEDGVNWSPVPIQLQASTSQETYVDERLFEIQCISFGNGRFVIIANNKSLKYSLVSVSPHDSSFWEFYRLDEFYNANLPFSHLQFASTSNLFVASFNQLLLTSDDGIAWSTRSSFFPPLSSSPSLLHSFLSSLP